MPVPKFWLLKSLQFQSLRLNEGIRSMEDPCGNQRGIGHPRAGIRNGLPHWAGPRLPRGSRFSLDWNRLDEFRIFWVGVWIRNYYAGFRARATSLFCFGKRNQNHVCLCAIPPSLLRSRLSGMPPPPSRIRWRGNSLRSNSPRRKVDSGLQLRRTQRNEPNRNYRIFKSKFVR